MGCLLLLFFFFLFSSRGDWGGEYNEQRVGLGLGLVLESARGVDDADGNSLMRRISCLASLFVTDESGMCCWATVCKKACQPGGRLCPFEAREGFSLSQPYDTLL